MSLSRRVALLAGAAVLAGCAAPGPSPSPSPSPNTAAPTASERDALVEQLRAGGVALYLRHPATDRGGIDDAHAPREEQRLLSTDGEKQARDLGATFTRQGIVAGRVLTSPS